MRTITYSVKLSSDAEPGTGLGTESINDLVPRDSNGHAYLPATHLKGLMRQHLSTAFASRGWDRDLLDVVLGAEGAVQSAVRISDARSKANIRTRTISRTAISEHGTASSGSLRTTEAIPAMTEFTGTLQVDAPSGEAVDLATRLGLQLISAVGGGRNRGGGACRIEIKDEKRLPGELLIELDRVIKTWKKPDTTMPKIAATLTGVKTVWFALVFRADGPICCPETPVVGVNHLRSGISIPASAVQGAVLTRLNALDSSMASACFASQNFRCWPLLPTSTDTEVQQTEVPIAVCVSLTHKISKLPVSNNVYAFKDEAIEPYKWVSVAEGSPLKGSTGVLLRHANGKIELWRSGDMPRMITAHGVHAGERNLFSVESLAPMLFSGIMAVPEAVATTMEKMFAADPCIAVGKSRTVRGGGRLELRRLESADLAKWQPGPRQASQVFVVQSPLELPEGDLPSSASEMLIKLVQDSGLGQVSEAYATTQVLFGWNRAAQGKRVGDTQRLHASRVISPGSVFVLQTPVKDLEAVLLKGVGGARERGFGAVLPHPGVAGGKFVRPIHIRSVKSVDEAGKWAFQLHSESQGQGPTPSQIGALAAKAAQGPDLSKAKEHMDIQQKTRSARFADVWSVVKSRLDELLKRDKELVCRTLRTWQDLAISHREKETRGSK